MAEKRYPGRPRGRLSIDVNDVIGKRVGMLKVVKYAFYKRETSKCGTRLKHFYLCQCDCGNIVMIRRNQILNNGSCSCGCVRRKLSKKGGKHNETNK